MNQLARLLKQILLMLKQVSLLTIQVGQVAKAVRVLEHLSALDGLVHGDPQKLELLNWVLFQIM